MPEAVRETAYQSEAELERLHRTACQQAYEHLSHHERGGTGRQPAHVSWTSSTRPASPTRSGNASSREKIAGANDGIIEKTARIQEDHIQVLTRDDGSTKNIYLLDKRNIHNNRLQVINQYEARERARIATT